jgi:serine protease Do
MLRISKWFCFGVVLFLLVAPSQVLAVQAANEDTLQQKIFAARDRVAPALVNVQPIMDVYSSGERRSSTAIGSGFIFDGDGHVITNYHVAGKAKRLIITLSTKQRVPGVVVGGDPMTDIAVLKLELAPDQPLPGPVTLGDSDALDVGEYVMALGSPLALQRSLSFGVVSSKDRFLSDKFKLPTGEKTGSFNTWIQTDAAINPGNSGGPLVNLRGDVVGVNSRGAFGASSIGFAIPINIVKEVAAELIEFGRVRRSWLGLEFQPREELAQYFEAEPEPGVLIRSVEPDSPAARAGIQAGDMLTDYRGQELSVQFHEQLPSIHKLIADTPVGEEVELLIYRQSQPLRITLTTEERSEASSEEMECEEWGFTARGITREYALEANLPDQRGVIVVGVKPNGAGFRAQLFPGDRVVSIEEEEVGGLDGLREIYQRLDDQRKEKVLLTVMRRHSRRLVLIEANYAQ